MPLWVFTHTPNTFSPEDKRELADQITTVYRRTGLPGFCVNVQFSELSPHDIYSGGPRPARFTTISIYHAAGSFQNVAERNRFLNQVDWVLTPLLKSKDIGWEYFIQEQPRESWKIDGNIPPEMGF
ncbi:hypothetical protein DTO271D3_8207 [Paecilomyces variotii]|nr:hypothetical protein DTO271D3_8207 [Paecilomyces variotii]KAJ9371036.1 hypothetical protein DTO282E5_4333 [Paecilomyces variotii]KAJ9399250.1 hypothetical protein DTO282F9_3873 [Paecilomyces variotii]